MWDLARECVAAIAYAALGPRRHEVKKWLARLGATFRVSSATPPVDIDMSRLRPVPSCNRRKQENYRNFMAARVRKLIWENESNLHLQNETTLLGCDQEAVTATVQKSCSRTYITASMNACAAC